MNLEASYHAAVDRVRALEKQVSALPRTDPARAKIKDELAATVAEQRDMKAKITEIGRRRNFAGLGSPLHAACVARLAPEVVAELEAEALALQEERERKRAAAPTLPPPAASVAGTPALRPLGPLVPEVFHTVRLSRDTACSRDD